MAHTTTTYEHIVLDSSNVPYINGTGMKVVELVQSKIAYGWSPEELHFQYPHISLGQIHSALAYYWDNREALDADIEERLRKVDVIQKATQPTPLQVRLRSKGLI